MFSPRKLIENAARSFAATASQSALQLFAIVDPSVIPWAAGDAQNLRQILGHLLTNALRFTESGYVIVRLRAGVRANGMQRLTLQVVDTGRGIRQEDQARLFRPLLAPGIAGEASKGRHTGLSLCAHLAAQMDSRIRVTSEPGLGSSFSLTLMLPAAEGPANDVPDLHGIRVHARSPHRELSANVCAWLSHWGATAEPVTIPPSCPEPDEVFLDLLPGADGRPAGWAGHYLPAHAPGPLLGGAFDPVDGYDLDSIGFAIARLMHGISPSRAPGGVLPEAFIPQRFRHAFLDTMNDDLAKLEQAIAKRDVASVLLALHRMRGALMMVAMIALANDISSVEAQLRHNGRSEPALLAASRLVLDIKGLLAQV